MTPIDAGGSGNTGHTTARGKKRIKLTPGEAGYREGMGIPELRCGDCVFYVNGLCEKVAIKPDADDVCNEFEPALQRGNLSSNSPGVGSDFATLRGLLVPDLLKSKAKWETMGRKGGPKAAGPDGECVCPECGYKTKHVAGEPCEDKECPKCKTPMVRKGLIVKGGSRSGYHDPHYGRVGQIGGSRTRKSQINKLREVAIGWRSIVLGSMHHKITRTVGQGRHEAIIRKTSEGWDLSRQTYDYWGTPMGRSGVSHHDELIAAMASGNDWIERKAND